MAEFKAEFSFKLLRKPTSVGYVLSGPSARNANQPGTSLALHSDGRFRWTVESAYAELTGNKVFISKPNVIEEDKWVNLTVTWDTETETGDILVDGESVVDSVEGEGGLGGGVGEVTELGWRGGSFDMLIWDCRITAGDRKLAWNLYEESEQKPDTTVIDPTEGTGADVIQWRSGAWKLTDEYDGWPWVDEHQIYQLSSVRWYSGTSATYYGYSLSSSRGEITPDSLPDVSSSAKIVGFQSYYLNNSFVSHRLNVSGFDAREYKATVVRFHPYFKAATVVGLTEVQFYWGRDDQGERILGTTQGDEEHAIIVEPATLSEQIEAKLKPAYEKDSVHYDCDDEPVILDEKGFITRDEERNILRPKKKRKRRSKK